MKEKIDKWLIEHVLEYEWINHMGAWYPTEKQLGRERRLSDSSFPHEWHPTEDIAQAFMCVDNLIEKGFNARLHNNKYLKEPWVFAVLDNNYNKITEANSIERCMAICLAMYKATGGPL